MHSLHGPAVEWLDDTKNYFINGASFPDERVWESIVSKEISAKDAINLPNAEQRTIACAIIGYDMILAELNAKRINHVKRKAAGSEHLLDYSLYEIDLQDDARGPARFLKVECASTGKETLLRVHPNCKSVDVARAWTFRMSTKEYALDIET